MNELVEAGIKITVDVVTGHVAAKVLDPLLVPTWALLKSFFSRFDEAGEAIRLSLREAREKYNQQGREDAERLKQTVERGEAEALVARLWLDAARASTRTRMEMLAGAVAGLLTVNLDSEMRSRVARAIEQLEPTDVIALDDAKAARVAGVNVQQVRTPQNASSLLLAGCLETFPGAAYISKYEVTQLGDAVLLALRTWTLKGALTATRGA